MAQYAWSPILTSNDKGELKTIDVGDTVSAADVGGKDHLELLVEAGAVRDDKYPKTNLYESPREANLRKLTDALAEAENNAYANLDFNVNAPEEAVSVPSES